MNAENGKIVIVKDTETGLLVLFIGEGELDIVGEAVFAPIRIEPFGEIPADAQEKYVEAALASVNLFREAGRWE